MANSPPKVLTQDQKEQATQRTLLHIEGFLREAYRFKPSDEVELMLCGIDAQVGALQQVWK
jgi:hypothetical protein